MPKNRVGRFVYALLVAVLLFVIGRNVYRRALNNRLIAAVEMKNVAAVRGLLARGADAATRRTEEGAAPISALTLALYSDVVTPAQSDAQSEIACLLIEHGALTKTDPAKTGSYLFEACRSGNLTLIRCLLEHGATVNDANTPGIRLRDSAPFDVAIEYASQGIVRPQMPPGRWSEPERLRVEADQKRHLAVSREMVRLLREHGAHLTLWQAARMNDVDALRGLLDAGTNINAIEPVVQGQTALMAAAEKGSLEAARLLLERSAKTNIVNGDWYSPLTGAISGQHLEVARLLLQHGADINWNANDPKRVNATPLVLACRELPQFVPELLERGANVKAVGGNAISAAMRSGRPDLVTLLLKHGADVRGKLGHSVLYDAIQYQPDLVPLFLAQGADARETGSASPQLIGQAARYGRKNLIAPLLRAGANIQSDTIYGSFSAPGSPNVLYTTPLIEALSQTDMVALLLQNGADPNRANAQGLTPLILAAQSGNVEVTRLLLAHGAKVNETGKMRQTPLAYALRHKHADVAALLRQAGGHER